MTAPLKTIEGSGDIAAAMREIGLRAKTAARVLALASTEQKNRALAGMAAAILTAKPEILAANAEDIADGKAAKSDRRGARPIDLERGARRTRWPKASTWCAACPIRSATSSSPGPGPTA